MESKNPSIVKRESAQVSLEWSLRQSIHNILIHNYFKILNGYLLYLYRSMFIALLSISSEEK